jgi:hypothetical protein
MDLLESMTYFHVSTHRSMKHAKSTRVTDRQVPMKRSWSEWFGSYAQRLGRPDHEEHRGGSRCGVCDVGWSEPFYGGE